MITFCWISVSVCLDADDLLVLLNLEYFGCISVKVTNLQKWFAFFGQELNSISISVTITIIVAMSDLSHFGVLFNHGHSLLLPVSYFGLLSSWKQDVPYGIIKISADADTCDM